MVELGDSSGGAGRIILRRAKMNLESEDVILRIVADYESPPNSILQYPTFTATTNTHTIIAMSLRVAEKARAVYGFDLSLTIHPCSA